MLSFANLFRRQSAPLIGLDISSSSVKLVELSKSPTGKLVLECCATELLEHGWILDGNVENFDRVAETIRRVVKKSGTRCKEVAMALPAAAVITKKITVPAGLNETEMGLAVESEASQFIPFSMDDVSLDYYVLGASERTSGSVEVMVAASRKEKVQDRQNLAEAADLKPVVVEVESFATRLAARRFVKLMPNIDPDAFIALFEIGSNTTGMQVMQNDEVLYEREQTFGGARLTQLIMRHYGFSADEAENKKRHGDLPEDFGDNVLSKFAEDTAQEVARALQFFFTSTPHNRVDYVMLAGGSASLPKLPLAVTENTSFKCQILNPFEAMALSSQISEKRLRREAPSYLSACGLAMRRFVS